MQNRPTELLTLVSRRLLWLGRVISHRDGSRVGQGKLIGLHHDGGLILEREGEQEVIYTGSISLENASTN